MLNLFDYQPFIVYSSLDNDAPVLSHAAHSVQTVLKACLVSGYGDKPAAGWAMPQDDVNGTGQRSFAPQGINDTGCVYTVRSDTSDSVIIDAALSGTIFATGSRSKRMYNLSGKSDWLVIANDESCYLLMQTDANQRWYAVCYFGNTIMTTVPHRHGALWCGDINYENSNYGILRMRLVTDDGYHWSMHQLATNNPSQVADGERIFMPPPFHNNGRYGLFVPGLMQSYGHFPDSIPTAGYYTTPHPAGDIVNIQTAWAEKQFFGIALGRTL